MKVLKPYGPVGVLVEIVTLRPWPFLSVASMLKFIPEAHITTCLA